MGASVFVERDDFGKFPSARKGAGCQGEVEEVGDRAGQKIVHIFLEIDCTEESLQSTCALGGEAVYEEPIPRGLAGM